MNSGVIDWLNENELRAYPLKESISRDASNSTGYSLTDDVLLDASFVYASLSAPTVLTSINVVGTTVTFICTGSIANSFAISKVATFPQYVRLSNGCLLVVGDGVMNIPDGLHTFTNVIFEPATSFEFSGDWLGVSTITFDGSSGLSGNINLIEGYQFDIAATDTQLTFDVGSSFGVPISCISFTEFENDCNDIISYINGIGADGKGQLLFQGGNGLVVLDDPDNHRLYVGLAFNPGDVCKDIVANPA